MRPLLRPALLSAMVAILLAFPSGRSVAFDDSKKAPEGVDPKMTSKDPDYGYTKKKPIKVGSSDELAGPKCEREYLDSLRDAAGQKVTYERAGSVGGSPEGHILDLYKVTTSDGKELELYIDMYHPKNPPKKQPAPKGLFKAKK